VVNNLVLHTIVSVDMLLLDGSELLVGIDLSCMGLLLATVGWLTVGNMLF
jgi:hypothetical protein